MKGRIDGLVEAFIAEHAHLLLLQLLGQGIFSFLDLLADKGDLLGSHLRPGHPAGGAVDVIQHCLALEVDEVSAAEADVLVRGIEESFEANGALRLGVVRNALVVLVGVWNTVPTGRTVREFVSFATAAHLAVILGELTNTQWNMSSTFLGLFS